MKIAHLLIITVAITAFCGCASLIPKRVELFQDKVKEFPVAKPREKELQRQAAQRAEETAKETLAAAIAEESSAAVIVPATETAVLTDVVSESLGPPAKPAPESKTSDALAQELRTSIAALNKRIDNFKSDNNENTGKKIEGTGLFQIPYFLWLGGIVALIFVLHLVLKAFLTIAAAGSPPVAIGMKAANVGGKLLSKGFSQLVKGGEDFKNTIKSEIKDADLQAKILQAFQKSHRTTQDADIQSVIKELTK
jgi:hypothetical protein